MAVSDLHWQPSLLLSGGPVRLDRRFGALERIDLDGRSWVDYAPGWVAGADQLFAELVDTIQWGQRRRWMYGRELDEPRLTARFSGPEPPWPSFLDEMRAALSSHYRIEFDSVGLNLYRDGSDSVAWHGDHIAAEIAEPLVALVSLGEPRTFRLRPSSAAEGGPPRSFALGRGDLLVTGGRCQREWQHSVPKVAKAGPRISLAFRHGGYEAAS
ncbi:MAG TPA: alpha-ketoglutarate-dependent dioxygenase AlkB [Acidimicrobiales bacterium]|nr:alpha-ketoglutarate-dependent dioxygenase AlkB [Acidimicrobiales bacterium]